MRLRNLTEEDFKWFQTRMKDGKQLTTRVRGAYRAEATAGSRSGGDAQVGTDLAKRPGHRQLDKLPPSIYKSKWEAAYANVLEMEKNIGIVKNYWYEPFSLWLPGKIRYKPDFMVHYMPSQNGYIELIEVKGWSKNRRDGMTRLKIAAALFPCFVWRLVYRQGNGWSGEYV